MFTYQETLKLIYEQLPMFHRIGPAAYKPDLSNTIALCKLAGNPERGLRCVHVAGTNGKGSTSHLLASVMQEAGYKTGLFTSPHLKDFRERIKVNGEMISEEAVTEFVNQFHKSWEALKPSFFEITAVMAFWYFKQCGCDISIIETGLGGRLDSTNVVTPDLSIITNIGFDHMNLLGDTLEKISAEKGGIIKKGKPVVLGQMRSEARGVLEQIAHSIESKVFLADQEHHFPELGLHGNYQEQNGKTAFAAIKQLALTWNISPDNIKNGFKNVVKNTGLHGRWEKVQDCPQVILDVAHNEDGMNKVVQQLATTSFHRLHVVIGMVSDKDIARVLRLLPMTATYYFCKADIPRGLNAGDLCDDARIFGLNGEVYKSVKDAYNAALSAAVCEDMVLVTGSVFTVAEVV